MAVKMPRDLGGSHPATLSGVIGRLQKRLPAPAEGRTSTSRALIFAGTDLPDPCLPALAALQKVEGILAEQGFEWPEPREATST